jgi:hypothetical protein
VSCRATPTPSRRLHPGDPLPLPHGRPRVRTVLHSEERKEAGTSTWSWIFADDGSLLELGDGGVALYRRHRALPHGSGLATLLVAQDGALVRFEKRRRTGSAGRRPVRVTLHGREFQVVATGTVAVTRDGDPPELGAWRALGPDAAENVYFRLRAHGRYGLVLGLWTTDVCLSFGRPLDPRSRSKDR